MIPKIIHYCWFGPKKMPRVIRKCIATWHDHMPDYEFCLWNEQNSPMEHPFVHSAYKAKKYAFVADYVRFWALYNYGGVYLDTDMYVLRNFDDLLNTRFFCAWELPSTIETTEDTPSRKDWKNTISCGALGACALRVEVKAILDEYDSMVFDAENLDSYIVPRIITPILVKHKEKITIYPYDYFYAHPFSNRMEHNFIKYATNNTYAIHLWEMSWLPWYKKLLRQIIIDIKVIIRHIKNTK